jgi:hypothetical protein
MSADHSREEPLDDGPDWRWQRLKSLVESDRQLPSRVSDPILRRGYQFFKKRAKAIDLEDRIWLQADFPDIYDAHAQFCNDNSEKWIIEAAVLAGQTDEFIAEYIGKSVATVKAYQDYFFDVRDKMKAEGYIQNRFLKLPFMSGAGTFDYDTMLKMAALSSGGWRLVRELLNHQQISPEGIKWLKISFLHNLILKGWISINRIEPNNFSSVELINSTLRLAEMEHNAHQAKLAQKDAKAQESELLMGLQVLLNSVQTGILRPEIVVGDEQRAMAKLEANHGENGQGN